MLDHCEELTTEEGAYVSLGDVSVTDSDGARETVSDESPHMLRSRALTSLSQDAASRDISPLDPIKEINKNYLQLKPIY